jgi:hypothetical protein
MRSPIDRHRMIGLQELVAPHNASTAAVAIFLASVALASACSAKKEEKSSAISAIASSSLAVRAPTVPSVTPAPLPEKPVIQRPKDAADLLVSTEKRARVESFAPEARGFLNSAELEEQLYKMQIKRGKDSDAVKALDQLAAGKWVLFTGNIGSPAADSFELPIRYTPKDPNDKLGLTNVWISVKLTKIRGYDASEYRPGELAVMLAKYEGKEVATGGYDVVLLGHWFEKTPYPSSAK